MDTHNVHTHDVSRRRLLGLGLGALAATASGILVPAQAHAVTTSAAKARLDTQMASLLAPINAGLYVYDWRSRQAWGYRATKAFNLASCVKVVTALSASRRARSAGRALSSTEKYHITQALRYSSNDSQTWLWNLTGQHQGYANTARWLGLSSGTNPVWGRGWGRSTSTPADLVKVMGYLVGPSGPVNYDDARWIAGVMNTSTVTWGVGSMGRTSSRTVRVKDGWVPLDGYWRINSMGHVYDPYAAGKPNYTAAILTTVGASMSTTKINQLGNELFYAMKLGAL